MSNFLKHHQDLSQRALQPEAPQVSLSPQQPLVQQLLALSPSAQFQQPVTSSHLMTMSIEALIAGDFQTRWEVAKLLPQFVAARLIPPFEAIDSLLTLLQDEDPDEELCWFLIRILGQLDNPEVLSALIKVLKTAESDELKAMAVAALASQGTPAIAALSELLATPELRLLAVRSLSQIRRSETIAPLLQVVQDADPAVRAAAIEALGSFHDFRVPPVLINALSDLNAAVRQQAVTGLGLRPDLTEEWNLVKRLRPHLWDFDLEVCRQAAVALGRLGAEAAAALGEVLCSAHTPLLLQVAAVHALGWISTDKAVGYLQQRLMQAAPAAASTPAAATLEETIVQEIVAELGRITATALQPRAAQGLIDLLATHPLVQQTPKLKQTVAMSLGQLGQPEAIVALIDLLADTDTSVRLHTVAALKQLEAQSVAPQIAYQHLQALAGKDNLPANMQQGLTIALAEWHVVQDQR
jgi:HEAT repeat protein